VKTCEDVAPNFGEKRPGCFSHFHPHPAVFGEIQNGCHPHQPHNHDLAPRDFFLFPKMKWKLEGRRFDTSEDIQAESKRVLDSLTEKNFQEAFQKWRRLWDRCLHV
jgi:hypothetical protein